jgi:methyltransferase
MVALHLLFPIGIVLEVWLARARPWGAWPLFFALVLIAAAIRLWSMRALGVHWTARIWVTPGMRLVTTGPYRWLRHPNYLAVVIEMAAAPLMFGAWRTAIAASVLNALALAIRIPVERAALREAIASVPAAPRETVARATGKISAIRGQEETSA